MLLLPTMTFGKVPPRRRVSRAVFEFSSVELACATPRRFAFLVGVLVLGLVGAGCGGDNDPRPTTWSYISTAILEPSCATANCHSAIATRAGVDLSTRAAGYISLVTGKKDADGNTIGGNYVISVD